MKLFIWSNPYTVSYGGSSVHAVAETLEEAKTIACSSRAAKLSYSQFDSEAPGRPENMTLGEPTFIFDVPCAVWDRWSE